MEDFNKVKNPMDDDDEENQQQQKSQQPRQAVSVMNPKNSQQQQPKKQQSEIKKKTVALNPIIQQSNIVETFNNEFGKNTLQFDHIIEECEHLLFGNCWEDPEFPANKQSLSLYFEKLPRQTQEAWQQIVWKRPNEFLNEENIKLFDVIEPDDIKQGLLGDCYFLCALSALAEQDCLIERLFHTKEKQKYGVYSVWLNINGEWININIDDRIPFKRDKPAFSRGQGDELWVLLLEKAYAKAYGSYEIIEGGNPAHALRDLTGAPCENVDNLTADEFWKYLEQNDNQQNVLTCYTKSTNVREEENELGILSGHAYSILDHQSVRGDDNQFHKILKIRNPWGMKEWTGDWSDNSDKWNPVLRQRLNVESKNDGTFWMSIYDFAKYFEGIGNCKVRPDYSYNSIKLDFTKDKIKVVQFKVKEATHGFISINQFDERMFYHSNKEYQYSNCRMFILKKNQKKEFEYVGALYGIDRNLYIEQKFLPGEYIVVAQIFWKQDIIRECSISSYSHKPISFEYLEGVNPVEMLKIAFKCVSIETAEKIDPQTGKELQKIMSYVKPDRNWNFPLLTKRYGFQYGSFYMYYKNGEMQQILNEELNFKMEGYIPLEPYYSEDEFQQGKYNGLYEKKIEITIPGDREAVILFDSCGSKFTYNFSTRPQVHNIHTDEGKRLIRESIQTQHQLLKEESDKFVAKKNVSSFGRSQIIGQVGNPDSRRPSFVDLSGIRMKSDNKLKSVVQPEQLNQNENTDIPEIEEECLEFFDDLLGKRITNWGLFINWITFLMFPIFLLQSFSKNTYLDMMIAMSIINLVNAEKLTHQLLRLIILALYFSLIVDIIFILQDHENNHLLTGQSLYTGMYKFSIFFVYIGILYKIFASFSYLHVYKNFLAVIPYIQQGFRKIRYFLRDLQLDKETIARLQQQYQQRGQQQSPEYQYQKMQTFGESQNKIQQINSHENITLQVHH
ncbi:calpain family cysteine protease (macronuclear) [Tetrahymena thermophila SB210]|uniref:Calpain family cysteine protease n=1 Tax=Tetrahymena thermophila (strain SB210) TaxID=312017 RepID=I7MG72_TETTS|nr:calpain family cysteine protease [Tetrahymena thermophila SB210]EAR84910.2 calpain family cysteine protease [Tetrahymena thermophila SB210]|eukprot:XP_001032573.2 calpain family cysteine protease [Tetrahymena thermophila SB210]